MKCWRSHRGADAASARRGICRFGGYATGDRHLRGLASLAGGRAVGASPRLGVGPTALTSLLIGASLAGMAEPGSAQWVTLAAWTAIMAGAVQWILGALRSGWLVNLVTSPVLNGFTQAAGILILLSQLPDLLGLRSSWSALLSDPSWHHFDPWALLFGAGGLCGLLLLKRFAPRLPAAVLVVAICGAISAVVGFAEHDGHIVGHLPAGLPSLAVPSSISIV